MRSAFDAPVSRLMPKMPPYRRRIVLSVLLVGMLLVGCRLPIGARPTAETTATLAPRFDQTPTIQIISSEELYGEDARAIGETSRGLASFPAGSVLPPAPTGASERGVTVLLDASASISGQLFDAEGPRQPGMLVLGDGVNAWGNLPLKLSQSGYVTLVLVTEATTQARHVETMLQSLIALPNVDAGLIGVVGAGRAADLALLGCAVNSLCDALALLSPMSRATLLNMLPSYGARPLWLAAGENDEEAFHTASDLAEAAQGEARFVAVAEGRGASMLQFQPELGDDLLVWLQSQLNAE